MLFKINYVIIREMKKLLYMRYGFGYLTPNGVKFSKEHPFQLVNEDEAQNLLCDEKFKSATAEELREYYEGESNAESGHNSTQRDNSEFSY